jgi:hypothetical protein
MIYRPEYFELYELVCPHVYYRFGEQAWQFLDPRQLKMMDWVREKLGPVFVNNWFQKYLETDYIKYIKERTLADQPIIEKDVPKPPKELLDERGLRCNLCGVVLKKTNEGFAYESAHVLGMGDDFDVLGRMAEEVRQYLLKNKYNVPFPIRLEKNFSWTHMDCEETKERVYLF